VTYAPLPADADFSVPLQLPQRLMDNAYSGWTGAAEIHWPEQRVRLGIECTPQLSYFVLFCPVGRDFFCFEPVTHPVNAFNLPAPHHRAGLKVLEPGASMAISVRFVVTAG
jgi:aldose 1-epimerase